MSDTKNPTSAVAPGSPPMKVEVPRPWEIAAKSWHTENGQTISVEQASDAQFQAFVKRSGIPVDDSGIPEWSFDDRIRFITYASTLGIHLPFCDQNNSDSELFVVPPEANGA